MGGGNAQKSAIARQRNAKNAKKEGKSTKKDPNKSAYKCAICMSVFPVTMKKDGLKSHSDGKHPKNSFEQCFPTFSE